MTANHGARLLGVEQLEGGIRIIRLSATTPFRFRAGQYLSIAAGQRRVPFTIASAPFRLPLIELHFRPLPGNVDAEAMIELLDSPAALEFDGPFGDVCIDDEFAQPLTILAGGTGISQAHAIVEQLSSRKGPPPVNLVWSVVQSRDAFCAAFFRRIASAGWLTFEIAVDTPRHTGAAGWLSEPDRALDGTVILAGSPGFVYSLVDAIEPRGWKVTLRADAFSYAPR